MKLHFNNSQQNQFLRFSETGFETPIGLSLEMMTRPKHRPVAAIAAANSKRPRFTTQNDGIIIHVHCS